MRLRFTLAFMLLCFTSGLAFGQCGSNGFNLCLSPNPAAVGATVTLTATNALAGTLINFTDNTPGLVCNTVPFPRVIVAESSAPPQSCTLASVRSDNGGTARLQITLTKGQHPLQANYFNTQTNNTVYTAAVTAFSSTPTTLVNLTATPPQGALCQPDTVSVQILPMDTTGMIVFADEGGTLGSVSISGGSASLPYNFPAGIHQLSASFNPDPTTLLLPSQLGNLLLPVTVSTTLTLNSTPNPSSFGNPVTLVASLSANSCQGSPAPSTSATGVVYFRDNNNQIGQPAPLVSGVATISPTSLAANVGHTLSAMYSGDSTYGASFSNPVQQTVTSPIGNTATTTVLSVTPTSSSAGQQVLMTATVSPSNGNGTVTTGTVTFLDGANPLNTASVSNGLASFPTTSLPVGTHSLTAAYNGGSGFTGSTSTPPVIAFVSPGGQTGPVSITPTGGASQSTAPNTPFPSPLQVTVLGSGGTPLSGQTVIFAAPSSGASAILSPVAAITNSLGVAIVNAIANGISGSYSVSATVGTLPSVFFSLTNGSPPPSGTNLALGKNASQSSTLAGYAGTGAASAVDGNPDGNFFDGSVATTNQDANAWWEVDLGAPAVVNSVVVYNRTDCCGFRLGNYWVFVSNTPFLPTDTPATLQNRPGTFGMQQTSAPNPFATIQFNGVPGQYVRVQLNDTDYLSLAEVQVIGTGGAPSTDLAQGRPATQSSTLAGYAGTGASSAVDGNKDGNFFDGSVATTNQDPNAWWEVDLGAPAAIGSVTIWNRTDCCGSRLGNYWVFVSSTPFLPSDTPATLQNRPGTFGMQQTSAPNPSATIPFNGVQGQFVRVQLNDTDFLSLAEVQVMGPGVTPPSTDLAQGRPATQSSTLAGYAGTGASSAVDGNKDGNFFDGSVATTNPDSNAWWEVDLGAPTPIGSVTVWNRTDCCGSRLGNYWVFVSNTPFLPTDTPATLQNRAGTFNMQQTSAPNPSATIFFNGAVGEYVRVQLNDTDYLSLAEVQVFAPSNSTSPNLALGKSASQSSTISGYPTAVASSAVDGSTDGNFFDGSVTATNADANAWWQVDLGASFNVSSVMVFNRTDCCSTRLNDYWVFVSNTPFLPSDTPASLQARGIFGMYQPSTPSPSATIPLGTQGRYVRVQLTGAGILSLAEVQVFGN